jgi:hypothetical protein
LKGQPLWHGRSVGLVIFIDFTSKGGRFRIEGDDKVVRLVVFEHFKEHPGEAKDGIGRKALGIGEMADGIKGTEDIRGTVNQKKSGAIRHNVLSRLKG